MPVSKAQVKAQTKWETKVYDKVLLRLKKGEREKIISSAELQGKSLNGYITEAINEKIEREGAVT
jgi:predicted HicB family RNase H-like nuclease